MQKIFFFEINTAIKDRPISFRIITLALFAFSLVMIIIGSFMRYSAPEDNTEAFKNPRTNEYVEFTSVTDEQPDLILKK
jgi:archaellum biogenesis protein FlaJ (TadC family)